MIGAMLIAVAAVIMVDQLSKRAIASRLAENEIGWRLTFLGIQRVTPPGHRRRTSTRDRCRLIGLWALAVGGSFLYAHVVMSSAGLLPHMGLGCAIGGATSNMLDRFWRGSVLDFIAVGFWPIFNLADVAIVGGVLVALAVAS